MYTVYSIVLLKSITVYLIIHLKLERKVMEESKTSLKSFCATGNTLSTHIFLSVVHLLSTPHTVTKSLQSFVVKSDKRV